MGAETLSTASAAESVRAIQKATGWTERRLADEIGVSQATVHRAKSGGNIAFATGQRLVALHDRCVGGERERLRWWRASLPYINRHRHGVFVLLLPAAALQAPRVASLAQDIALLSSLGARLVLVYDSTQRVAARLGRRARWHRGRLLVPSASLDSALETVAGLGVRLTAQLSSGMPRSPMHGAQLRVGQGNAVVGRPLGVLDGIDMQHSGAVRRIDVEDLRAQLEAQRVLLLPPLGYSPSGEVFCLDAGELAAEAAVALDADKLIAFCPSSGVLGADGALLSELDVAGAERLAASEDAEAPQWLAAVCDAVRRGVGAGHVIGYADDDALLRELFSDGGAGTLVRERSAARIRPAGADDIVGLLALIEPLERRGVLLARPRERLEAELGHFLLAERDGGIVACAALYPWRGERAGELACLAVHPEHRRAGLASRLLAAVERRAADRRLDALFALSTTARHWFEERGFTLVDAQALPVDRQWLYNDRRNAKVFVKRLTPDSRGSDA